MQYPVSSIRHFLSNDSVLRTAQSTILVARSSHVVRRRADRLVAVKEGYYHSARTTHMIYWYPSVLSNPHSKLTVNKRTVS